MDTTAISTLIGSLGFPIIMCFMMAYYISQSMAQFTQIASKVENTVEKNQRLLEEIEDILNKKE